MKGIADTGFIVALVRRNDRHHRWALDIAKAITEPLLICEAVLAESAFHLESSAYVLSLLPDEMLRVAAPEIWSNYANWRDDMKTISAISPMSV
jgi:predicted nucleic acid-binding protein